MLPVIRLTWCSGASSTGVEEVVVVVVVAVFVWADLVTVVFDAVIVGVFVCDWGGVSKYGL